MRVATLLTLTLLGVSPGVARADIESMGDERSESRNCARPHADQALWRSRDGTILFAGAGTKRFEFYGHGVDLTRDVRLTGISGGSATAVRGVGGVVNGARGCGNIGSLVVEITMPEVGGPNSGTLVIGSERLAVKAVPMTLRDVSWERSNAARPNSNAAATSTAPATGSAGPMGASGGAPCLPPECDPNRTGTGARMLGTGTSTGSAPRTLGDCLANLGGSATITGGTLELKLPRQRSAQDMNRCSDYPMPIDLRLTSGGAHAVMGSVQDGSDPLPELEVSGPGTPPRIACASASATVTRANMTRCRVTGGVGVAVFYSGQALQSVSGVQSQTLQLNLAGSSQRLTLRVDATP